MPGSSKQGNSAAKVDLNPILESFLFAKSDGPVVDWHANVLGFGLSQKNPSGIRMNVSAMEGRGGKNLPRGSLSKHYRAFTSDFPLTHGRLPVTVREPAAADANYLHRLLSISKHINPTTLHCLHALDLVVDRHGEEVPEETLLHVPNGYVWSAARESPESFFPGLSIHPYRKDALARLEHWANETIEAGLPLVIVWHPSLMNIDLASPKAKAFYTALASYTHAILYTTVGPETHMTDPNPELSNPLALRAPLDAGLTVIAAGCGLDGTAEDTDLKNPTDVPAYSLFYRVFDTEAYKDRLFGCLTTLSSSASPAAIAAVLMRGNLDRFVYGSNYPAPELKDRYAAVRLDRFLTGDATNTKLQRQAELEALQKLNPVLGDIIVKRMLKAPAGEGARLPASVFQSKARLWKTGEKKAAEPQLSEPTPAPLRVEVASVSPDASAAAAGVGMASPTSVASSQSLDQVRSPNPAEPISVVFVLSGVSTAPGDRVSVCGSAAALGEWDLARGAKLAPSEADGLWSTTVTIPVGTLMDTNVEFKYVKVSMDGVVSWEPLSANRALKVSSLASLVVLGAVRETSTWGEPTSPTGILGSPVSPSKMGSLI